MRELLGRFGYNTGMDTVLEFGSDWCDGNVDDLDETGSTEWLAACIETDDVNEYAERSDNIDLLVGFTRRADLPMWVWLTLAGRPEAKVREAVLGSRYAPDVARTLACLTTGDVPAPELDEEQHPLDLPART